MSTCASWFVPLRWLVRGLRSQIVLLLALLSLASVDSAAAASGAQHLQAAKTAQAAGKSAAAEREYQQAIAQFQREHDPKGYGEALYRRGVLLAKLKRLSEAQQPLQQASQVTRQAYGDDSLEAAIVDYKLAVVWTLLNRQEQARALVPGVFKAFEQHLGADDATMVEAENALAPLLVESDPSLAVQHLRHALSDAQKKHPKLAPHLSFNLAAALCNSGSWLVAERYATDAVNGYDAQGNHGPEFAESLLVLGKALLMQHRDAEAQLALQRSRTLIKTTTTKARTVQMEPMLAEVNCWLALSLRHQQSDLRGNQLALLEEGLRVQERYKSGPAGLKVNILDLLAVLHAVPAEQALVQGYLQQRMQADPEALHVSEDTVQAFAFLAKQPQPVLKAEEQRYVDLVQQQMYAKNAYRTTVR